MDTTFLILAVLSIGAIIFMIYRGIQAKNAGEKDATQKFVLAGALAVMLVGVFGMMQYKESQVEQQQTQPGIEAVEDTQEVESVDVE